MTNAVCTYDFTAKGESNLGEVKNLLSLHAKKWVFQLEEGESGYKHYQGRLSLKVKKRLNEIIKLFNTNWHFSITSSDNRDNDFYVTKSDTRIDGPWKDTDQSKYIPRQIRDIEKLFDWQNHIVNDAKIWDTRTINIILDNNGNIGKSTLKTYIGVHGIGRSVPYFNDYKDIMRIIMDTPKMPLYIIDIPRALKKEHMYQFFSGIETLKDGYAFDDRYSFKEEYFDCPNIWIFMNVLPDMNYLSKDRWKIWEVINGTLRRAKLCNTIIKVPGTLAQEEETPYVDDGTMLEQWDDPSVCYVI